MRALLWMFGCLGLCVSTPRPPPPDVLKWSHLGLLDDKPGSLRSRRAEPFASDGSSHTHTYPPSTVVTTLGFRVLCTVSEHIHIASSLVSWILTWHDLMTRHRCPFFYFLLEGVSFSHLGSMNIPEFFLLHIFVNITYMGYGTLGLMVLDSLGVRAFSWLTNSLLGFLVVSQRFPFFGHMFRCWDDIMVRSHGTGQLGGRDSFFFYG
ncbi:hypothetical protein B0T24DRAFT_97587 [Lasiosphaeria ovina]|uniref:Uncharacterized protein n=1 Tax=Lasiosphaeria ovina TaxID=92902 RepID=A0AAE0JUX2_9PEZI|nr:hypothetical protein B0T24DRAFT_97587 [Lasiosphaeria ovina]